jgi:transposase-like protein
MPWEKIVEIIYYFGIDLQIYEVEKLMDVNHKTVIEWYDKLRALTADFLKDDPIILGQSMEIIEIDESLYGEKRKYNRGTGRQDTWVFGMVEKGTRKVIFQVVERRNKTTLMPIIKENTLEGSTIHSDCWSAYNSLVEEGFVHKTVNHSKEFKSEDGTCTNEIEGIWGMTKNKIKKMKGILHERIGAFLNEFSYRYRYGHSNGDVYEKLIHDIGNFKF